MLSLKVRQFEKEFRKTLVIDRKNNGFTDVYVAKHYAMLPTIFEGSVGNIKKESLQSALSLNLLDVVYWGDFAGQVTTLQKLNSSDTLPYPFKDEVIPRIESSDPMGKELMSFAHLLYLNFYLQVLHSVTEKSKPLKSNFFLSTAYDDLVNLKKIKENNYSLDESQIKYLRLNYVYIIKYLIESFENLSSSD